MIPSFFITLFLMSVPHLSESIASRPASSSYFDAKRAHPDGSHVLDPPGEDARLTVRLARERTTKAL